MHIDAGRIIRKGVDASGGIPDVAETVAGTADRGRGTDVINPYDAGRTRETSTGSTDHKMAADLGKKAVVPKTVRTSCRCQHGITRKQPRPRTTERRNASTIADSIDLR